ncbi:MAG: hypothetical protein JWR26_776 [Pedosphaera sp.]|nr:hypothetical protein [Pedosphaera sp.]
MKISVVVPAFNEEKLIGETLKSVSGAMAAFVESGWESELIVCDNNSTDRTPELARAAGAAIVFEPINQIGRARNKGAEAATGDWLIFIDADSQATKGLFAEVIQTIETGKVLFGGCTIKLEGAPLVARVVTRIWNGISRVGKYAAGSFIFCETAAFRKLGGFDNRLFAGEEIDLSKRLKQLARETGKRAVILHRNRLLTSARKLHLYSAREHLRFVVKTMVGWRRTVTSRDACHTWYDGRR